MTLYLIKILLGIPRVEDYKYRNTFIRRGDSHPTWITEVRLVILYHCH